MSTEEMQLRYRWTQMRHRCNTGETRDGTVIWFVFACVWFVFARVCVWVFATATGEAQVRYRRDAGEIQVRYRGDAVEIQVGCE